MTETRNPEVSIVIPAFNEAERLPKPLEGLQRFIAAQALRYEVVLSDDGSTDGTQACFERCAAGLRFRSVRSDSNKGKGHAVRLGMLAARGAIRVMFDADGSMPAEELPKLVEPLRTGVAEIAIGSRYLDGRHSEGQSASRRAWSRFAHSLVKRTLVPGIEDTHCGYKAFTAAVAQDIFSRAAIDRWAFDLEVLSLAQHLGYRVSEISVEWKDDERSRVRAVLDIWTVVEETLRIRSNFRRGVYRLDQRA